MSITPVPFSKESPYVKAVLLKLKRENRFHIENDEDTIDICDFFEELLNLVEKERKGRQGVNCESK